MKHLYIILMLVVCCTWFSCSSDNKTPIYQVKMSVSALGVEKEYTLKEFADPTEEITVVSTHPSWVSVDFYTDDNDQLVAVVTVDENTEDTERQHQLIVKAQNGNEFQLDITQKTPLYYETSLDFVAKGGSHTMTLEGFTPPVVSAEGLSDWLQLEWKSETSKVVTITATENPSSAERTAQVILKDSEGNRTTLSINQHFFTDDSDSTDDEQTDQPAL